MRGLSLRSQAQSRSQIDAYVNRHIGVSPDDIHEMLAVIGVESLARLIERAVPADVRRAGLLRLPPAAGEAEISGRVENHRHARTRCTGRISVWATTRALLPSVIQRNVLENPAWYTHYTPYQPEIAQGRLEALLNFQTMVTDLTGMDIANASLLDEGTAAAEAMTMCKRAQEGIIRQSLLRLGALSSADHRRRADTGAGAWV